MTNAIIAFLSMIGFVAAIYGAGFGLYRVIEHFGTERERRRDHDRRVLAELTRIANNTAPKP